MKRFLALVVTAVALQGAGGCGHTPAASPRQVRFVTERDLVKGCTHLGRVTGSSSFGGISGQQLGKVRSEAEMRDQAERLGADVVLVDYSSGGFWGAKSVGDAYSCLGRAPDTSTGEAPPTEMPKTSKMPTPSMTPAPVLGGCEKDTDCKGDRICESGRCVKP